MSTPVPPPVVATPAAPAEPTGNTHPGGVTGWIKDHLHLLPHLDDLAADADKARKVIPLVQEFLPKLTKAAEEDPELAAKIAPLVAEAGEIASVIAAL